MSDTAELLSVLKLQLNVKHPSVEDCYVYGYEAAAAGIEEQDNPFRENTCEYDHWSDGWWAGFYEEAPLFSLDDSTLSSTKAPAANDQVYTDGIGHLLVKVLEITSVIVVAALVGYQMLELVA